MNCEAFAGVWPSFVAGTCSDEERNEISAHAQTCAGCRRQLEQHEQLTHHLKAMIRMPNPDELAAKVQRKVIGTSEFATDSENLYRETSAAAAPLASRVGSPGGNGFVTGICLGLLIGIVGTSLINRPQPSIQEQIIAQMYLLQNGSPYVRPRSRTRAQQALPPALGSLPAITSTGKVVLSILVLGAFARSKVWELYAGSTLPAMLRFGRVICLLAIILGLVYAGLTLSTVVAPSGEEWKASVMVTLYELWSISYWLTVGCLVLAASQICTRRAATQRVV